MRKLQTIYEYFNEYTREDVDKVLSTLTEEEWALVKKRYGSNLDDPVSTKLTKKESSQFYVTLISKLRRRLFNLYNDPEKSDRNPSDSQRSSNKHSKVKEQTVSPTDEQTGITLVQDMEDVVGDDLISEIGSEGEIISIEKIGEVSDAITNEASDKMTKDDCIKILKLLKEPTFKEMIEVLSVKEAIIISLRLGYVDEKYFSTKAISQFLGIEESEVIEVTKKVLLLYKKNINSFLDNVIKGSFASDKGLTMTKK